MPKAEKIEVRSRREAKMLHSGFYYGDAEIN